MIENEKEIQEQLNPTDATETPTEEIVENEANNESTEQVGNEEKTFTQEQVDNFIKERLNRQKNSLYSKFGIENDEQIDTMLEERKEYPTLKDTISKQMTQIKDLSEELAFVKNDIDKNRISDIRAYFKGKDLEFSNDALVKELETHPEWKNASTRTTIETLSTEHANRKIPESDEEKMKRIFNI